MELEKSMFVIVKPSTGTGGTGAPVNVSKNWQ